MRSLKLLFFSLSIFSFASCNDTANVSTTTAASTRSASQALKTSTMSDVQPVDLTKFGISDNPDNVLGGLKVGDKAPDFMMQDQNGKEVTLSTSLKDGPVLLVFLRAEWCSFCIKHLKEFQDNIQRINDGGQTQVLAVSPQLQSYMKTFHEENKFSFPILYDEDHSIMRDYKVLFHVTDKYNAYIKKAKGETIETFNGDKEPIMPVPATYLIGQDGTIEFVHYDPDYKKRSDLTEVMLAL